MSDFLAAWSTICDEQDTALKAMTQRERTQIAKKAGSRGRPHSTVRKHLKRRFDGAAALPRTAVVDMHGQWMAQWKHDFDALGIRHTRSHADLHPCPFDFASLRVCSVQCNGLEQPAKEALKAAGGDRVKF